MLENRIPAFTDLSALLFVFPRRGCPVWEFTETSPVVGCSCCGGWRSSSRIFPEEAKERSEKNWRRTPLVAPLYTWSDSVGGRWAKGQQSICRAGTGTEGGGWSARPGLGTWQSLKPYPSPCHPLDSEPMEDELRKLGDEGRRAAVSQEKHSPGDTVHADYNTQGTPWSGQWQLPSVKRVGGNPSEPPSQITSLLQKPSLASPCLYSSNPEHNTLCDVAPLTPPTLFCASFLSSPLLFQLPLAWVCPSVLIHLTFPNSTIYFQCPAQRSPSPGTLSLSAPGKSKLCPPLWSIPCVTLACGTDFCPGTYYIVHGWLCCCTVSSLQGRALQLRTPSTQLNV